MKERYQITMPDNSIWEIPVMIIARNRAEEYASEFDNDVEKSLKEDTLPLFDLDSGAIHDWAQNNMNWKEVQQYAVKVKDSVIDYQEGWINGKVSFR